jgi:hypothetical protein
VPPVPGHRVRPRISQRLVQRRATSVAGTPEFSHSETAACLRCRATAALRCRIVCPRAYARGLLRHRADGSAGRCAVPGTGASFPHERADRDMRVMKRREGAGRPAVDGAGLTVRRTAEGDQMRDSIRPARLTRSRRAHLLAVAVFLSVVLAAGCGGGPGSTAPQPCPPGLRRPARLPAACFTRAPAMPRTCSGSRMASSPCWTRGSMAAARR